MQAARRHNGNGVAITSIEYAHGLDHHWLHRLHPEGTYAAGCIQCHEGAIHLDDSPMFNRAKGKYLSKGCWGCHPRDGYAGETQAIVAIDQRMGELAAEITLKRQTQTNLRAVVDPLYEDEDNDDSTELADEMLSDMQPKLAGITAQIAVIETEMDVLRAQARDLGMPE